MPGSAEFGHQFDACTAVRQWSRQARRLVVRLRADPAAERAAGPLLDDWAATLAKVAAEAEWHLVSAGAGLVDPTALVRFLVRVEPLTDRFLRFVSGLSVRPEEAMELTPVGPVPIGEHRLPPLPYPYDALEPHIDAETMRLHHDKHHQSYVDGLNRAERRLAAARRSDDFELVKHWEREAAFHGAGHYLHTVFWNVMHPEGGGAPSGALADCIARDFGDLEAFRRHFSAAANDVEAVGWALLVWAPRAHRLAILTAEKHQNLSQWDVVPLLVLDVWEHAYYLKYQNRRQEYVDAWRNVVHWPHVAERFERAQTLKWEPW